MSAASGIEKYREFVDELVERREGVLPEWILGKGWPPLPENEQINAFLSRLTADEKEIVARIAREARDDGIHDTLVFLQEQMDLKNLRLIMDGVELPVSPFDTEIFWDWVARADGAPWPALPSDQ
ncbi:DUF6547 family protein [Sorangium sp. So ce513]|uniref:DUF6547 family protein n=1 Tax=Sorangium sp. So ce513 TaxID=3133315 RepID=UPI003F5DC0CE